MTSMILTDKAKCKRCGNTGYICINGYCSRCDDVIFGKQEVKK